MNVLRRHIVLRIEFAPVTRNNFLADLRGGLALASLLVSENTFHAASIAPVGVVAEKAIVEAVKKPIVIFD